MSEEQLYIDGQLVDLSADSRIVLKYDSPLFSDLQKIMSNRTFTIKLPKTDDNIKIFRFYNLPEVGDWPEDGATHTVARRWHKVDYFRGGMPIVIGAMGWLLETTMKHFEYQFLWGNMEAFDKMYNSKLTDLIEKEGDEIKWNGEVDRVINYGEAKGFAIMDCGMGVEESGGYIGNSAHVHPVVSVNWILSRMGETNGVTIASADKFKDLYVPLLTKKANWVSAEHEGLKEALEVRVIKGMSEIHPQTNHFPVLKIYVDGRYLTHKAKKARIIAKRTFYDATDNILRVISDSNEELAAIEVPYTGYPGSVMDIDVTVDLNGAESFRLIFDNNIAGYMDDTPNELKVFLLTPKIIDPTSTVAGALFPVSANLPDMRQSDFLKGLLQFTGQFAHSKIRNHIALTSVADFVGQIVAGKMLDWSGKLCFADKVGVEIIESIQYSLDFLGEENILNWADDDSVAGDFSGVIRVENKTIDKSKDLVKLPFSPSEQVGWKGRSIAKLNLYTPDEEGVVEYHDNLKPRILKAENEEGKLVMSFSKMSFKESIERHYVDYQNIVLRPRVLTVYCTLSDHDVMALDLTKPVYFSQLGHSYAILEITVQKDRSKCKLLEINHYLT